MNLVAKEYCAAKVDCNGVLLLSEFTGAAAELKDALYINPFYIEQMADTLQEALHLPTEVREAKMFGLRETIRQYDIHYWVSAFMEAFSDAVIHREYLACFRNMHVSCLKWAASLSFSPEKR